MIIYDAQQFGLATLHQLRGRIGRDGNEAICYLLTEQEEEISLNRLDVLVKSNDGFLIALEDLKQRGPGELMGNRQAGIPQFNYVNIVKDFKILALAIKDVYAC
jgi:ATP-dependent DNA helicase RecG